MNPDLQAVWNKIAAHNAALQAQGQPPLSSDELDQLVKLNSDNKYSLKDVDSASAQGANAATARTDYPLKTIWSHIVASNAELKASGQPPLAPAEIDQFIRDNTGGKFSLDDITKLNGRNLGRSFVQGATMNWADELAGGKASPDELASIKAGGNVAGAFLGAPGMGDVASKAREVIGWLSDKLGGSPDVTADMRLRGRMFHEAHPVADVAAGMAGAVAPALLLPEAEAATLAGSVARGAAVGAGTGALAGAGAGEDADSRIRGVVVGGVLGGGLGSIVPAVVGATKYVTDPSRVARRYVTGAINEAGGPDAIAAKAAAYSAAGKGNLPVLADLSPQLRALADASATQSPSAAARIAAVADPRQAGMSGRLLADVTGTAPDLGGDVPDATTALAALHKSNMDWARGAYDDLRGAYPEVSNTAFPRPADPGAAQALATLKAHVAAGGGQPTPAVQQVLDELEAKASPFAGMNPQESDFAKILQQPAARRALDDAKQLTMLGDLPEPGDQPSFEKMFHIKGRIEAAADKAWRAGDGDLGTRLGQVQQAIDNHLVTNVPGYSDVTQQYAQRMGLERALNKGVDAWNSTDNAGLLKLVATLSPDELWQYRYGMASELASKLRNAASSSNTAHQLLDASIAKDEKLGVIFGDQPTFNDFMRHADLEADMAKLRGTYTGSATGARTAAFARDPADLALTGAAHGLSSGAWNVVKAAGIRAASAALRRNLRTENANQMTPLLLTKGTPAIDALLQSFRSPPALMGAVPTNLLPSALSAPVSQITSP